MQKRFCLKIILQKNKPKRNLKSNKLQFYLTQIKIEPGYCVTESNFIQKVNGE